MEPIKDPGSLQPHPPKETKKPARATDPFAGVDLDIHRRPGYASLRGIKPWPNSRPQIERQPRRIKTFMHGRPNKTFPPVFGTDVPPKGLSGQIRQFAYRYPDHMIRHWLILLASDRVDSLEYHAPKLLALLVPALTMGLLARSHFRAG